MRPEIILCWLGKTLGVATTALLLTFLFGGREHFRPTLAECLGLLFFPGGLIVGFCVAWWRQRLGSIITLASLGCFYVWIFCRDGRIPTTPYFLLLAAPAVLHLASDLIACRTGSKTGGSTGSPIVKGAFTLHAERAE